MRAAGIVAGSCNVIPAYAVSVSDSCGDRLVRLVAGRQSWHRAALRRARQSLERRASHRIQRSSFPAPGVGWEGAGITGRGGAGGSEWGRARGAEGLPRPVDGGLRGRVAARREGVLWSRREDSRVSTHAPVVAGGLKRDLLASRRGGWMGGEAGLPGMVRCARGASERGAWRGRWLGLGGGLAWSRSERPPVALGTVFWCRRARTVGYWSLSAGPGGPAAGVRRLGAGGLGLWR